MNTNTLLLNFKPRMFWLPGSLNSPESDEKLRLESVEMNLGVQYTSNLKSEMD